MTNLEFYKDEFVKILKVREPCLCNYFCAIKKYDECSDCPFYKGREEDCDYYKFADWLLEEHKESIKLKKWEKDLLKCYQETKDDGEFEDNYILKEMQYKGHFQDVDYNLTIEEIIDNCEVIEK